MRTVAFVFSVLVLAHFASCFLKEEIAYDFVDASPSTPLRFAYATPNAARDDMTIDISITGDFGYYFDESNPIAPGKDNQRYMVIKLISPSGITLDLGTYFNNNQLDNAPLAYQKFYPYFNAVYYLNGQYVYNQYPNYGDRGYYNVQHRIVLVIPYDIINPITKEGGFTIEYTFSAAVNPWFSPLPDINFFGLNELFMSVLYFEGGIIGDPHFFGWDGQLFDFQGEPNKIYNAVTHKNLQLNLKLKEKEFASVANVEELSTLAHNTFIGSIGLQTPSYDVAIHSGGSSTEDEAGYVLINHKMYQIKESGVVLESDALRIEWDSYASNTLHKSGVIAGVLQISTPEFEFRVFIIEQGRNLLSQGEWNSHPFRFLELAATHKTSVGEVMHGLLGQTAPKVHALVSEFNKLTNSFKLEGSNSDYEVSHLFGGDFKFNIFSKI